MSTYICEFCSKHFKNNFLLKRHKLSAKYCLNIQKKDINIEEVNENELDIKDFVCESCNKTLKSKQSFNCHIKSCKEIIKKNKLIKEHKEEILKYQKNSEFQNNIIKDQEKQILEQKFDIKKYQYNIEHKDELIEEYKKQILDLQNRLERLHVKAIEKPTNVTNNHNNKIDLKCFNLSQESINDKIFSKFNDNYMYNGISGIAQFVKDHVITLEDGSIVYACFDKARKIFKYKDKDGNVIKDPKALKLISLIQPALKEQSQILFDYFANEFDNVNKNDYQEINKVNTQKELALKIGMEISTMHENQKFSNELSNITS